MPITTTTVYPTLPRLDFQCSGKNASVGARPSGLRRFSVEMLYLLLTKGYAYARDTEQAAAMTHA